MTQYSPTSANPLQVTVDLTNGAKFIANPTLTCLTTTGSNSAALNVAPIFGGAATTQAVFSITTGGANTPSYTSTGCIVTATTVSVTGAHVDVGLAITYKYGSLASSTVNGTLITFISGLTAAAAAGNDAVAQVGSGFVSLTGAATSLSAGTITWGKQGSAAATATMATPFNLGDALGATSGSITVAGASLAATRVTAGVWLQTVASGACAATAGGGVLATAAGGVTPITFTGLTPSDLSAGVNVCMAFDGTTAIPAGSITATLGGTALSGHTLPAQTAKTLLTITRNGTTLVAPLVNVPAGWISRLVLVNRGAASANYTVTATGETGTTVTLTGAAASGTLTGSSTTVVDLSTLMTTVGNTRGSLEVIIGGSSSNVDGLYQLVNATTGSVSNYTLISK